MLHRRGTPSRWGSFPRSPGRIFTSHFSCRGGDGCDGADMRVPLDHEIAKRTSIVFVAVSSLIIRLFVAAPKAVAIDELVTCNLGVAEEGLSFAHVYPPCRLE